MLYEYLNISFFFFFFYNYSWSAETTQPRMNWDMIMNGECLEEGHKDFEIPAKYIAKYFGQNSV